MNMRVAVFTPTRQYGGIDIAEASLDRQTYRPSLWILADELKDQRRDLIKGIAEDKDYEIAHVRAPFHDGNWRNLAGSYNLGMETARRHGVDLFVSMQDYFWLPEDGIERFVRMAEEFDGELLTGLAHIASEPGVEQVFDPKGLYSIFREAYTERPMGRSWNDVRKTNAKRDKGYIQRNPIEWETNWAAITRPVLYGGVSFDEYYDRGVAYENQDFAARAHKHSGAEVILDLENAAIGFPHKWYWPEQEKEDEPRSNMAMHHARHPYL
jgi:hypothetical protein